MIISAVSVFLGLGFVVLTAGFGAIASMLDIYVSNDFISNIVILGLMFTSFSLIVAFGCMVWICLKDY